ncbi:MAG: hypothetical protein QXR22_04635, partial [Acidilobaceae archaeon]
LVKISSIELGSEGLYIAKLRITYGGRSYEINIEKLLRKPFRAKARLEGNYILVNIEDNEGKPLSSCCIHVEHLEKGCMDCKSLLIPPL